jgi:hypothetical protein
METQIVQEFITFYTQANSSVTSWLWPMIATLLVGASAVWFARSSAKSAQRSAELAEKAHEQIYDLNRKAARPWIRLNKESRILINKTPSEAKFIFQNVGISPLENLKITVCSYPKNKNSIKPHGTVYPSDNLLAKEEDFYFYYDLKSNEQEHYFRIIITYEDGFFKKNYTQELYLASAFNKTEKTIKFMHVSTAVKNEIKQKISDERIGHVKNKG